MTLSLLLAAALFPALDDRPPLEDLARFPTLEVCEAMLDANRAYREHLTVRQEFSPQLYWEYQEAISEAACLYESWSSLAWAHRYHGSYGRDQLATLRDLLGPADYHGGRMPPCLPLERFAWRE